MNQRFASLLNFRQKRRPGAGPRKKWKPRKSAVFTAVDVEGSLLRLCQARRRKTGCEILRYAARQLEFPASADRSDPQAIGTAIADAFKQLKWTPGKVVMGLPRAQVLLHSLALPAAGSTEEMAAMVLYQFGKELPFPSVEAVIDFTVQAPPATNSAAPPAADGEADSSEATSESNAPAKTEVLAAAARWEVIQHYQTLAAAARVELTALGLRSHAHARCLEACQAVSREEAAALVTLRRQEAIIDVLHRGSLRFSRTATLKPVSAADDAKVDTADSSSESPSKTGATDSSPEAFLQSATVQVNRTLHAYESMREAQPVRRIIVVGDTGFEEAATQTFSTRLNLPCQLLEPSAALGLPDGQAEHAAAALAVIGLALGAADAGGLPFDFLNPKRPPAPSHRNRARMLAIAAVAALLAFSLPALRAHWIGQHLAKKNKLQSQVTAEQKHVSAYRRMRWQAQTVRAWANADKPWLSHLAYLSAVLPSDSELYATSFSVSSRGTLQLTVQAASGEILARLDKLLRNAGYLVKPLAVTPTPNKFGYPFRTTLELSLPSGKAFKFDAPPIHSHPGRSIPGSNASDHSSRQPARPEGYKARALPVPSAPARPGAKPSSSVSPHRNRKRPRPARPRNGKPPRPPRPRNVQGRTRFGSATKRSGARRRFGAHPPYHRRNDLMNQP